MSEQATSPPPDRHIIHLLCMGRRRGAESKKKLWLWYSIEPGQNDGSKLKYDEAKAHHYSGKNIIHAATPGCIVAIQASADNKTVYPRTAQIVGRWQNRDDLTLWQATERAEEGEIESEQRLIRELKESLPSEALAPFRRAYHRLRNSRQQSHLLAWIIQEITRYRSQDE